MMRSFFRRLNKYHLLCKFLAVAFVISQLGNPATAAQPSPRTFPSAEEAAQGLVEAFKAQDRKAALQILGPSAKDWIFSGDPVADTEARNRFVRAYDQKHSLAKEGDARATLVIGNDDFPFPFPLVKSGDTWRFDPEQGREEILNRRVGKNELYTIQVLLAIVDAQREYVSIDRNGTGFLEYAQKFISSPGKHDGLYWPTQPAEPLSPLGPLVGQATREGYDKLHAGKPTPYHGYYYRILYAQGKAAPGGAYDYLVRNKMIGGFAVLAYPAKYGVSGIKSFLVNHQGVVFEKDLGPDTAKVAGRLRSFNPDNTWEKN